MSRSDKYDAEPMEPAAVEGLVTLSTYQCDHCKEELSNERMDIDPVNCSCGGKFRKFMIPSVEERISDYQIDRQLKWLDNSGKGPEHDFSIIARIIRQQREQIRTLQEDNLARQALEMDATGTIMVLRKQIAELKAKCLPWVNAYRQIVDRRGQSIQELDKLITKLTPKDGGGDAS
jgi:hypothetical protein